MSDSNKLRFQLYIRDVLSKNPSWLPEALTGITQGMQASLDKAYETSAQYHMAMLCALGIADKKRLSAETQATLLKPILKAIKEHPGGTEAEANFLEWANGR